MSDTIEIKLSLGEETAELRRRVFALEQGYPEKALFDERESEADFLTLTLNGEVVGCGRFFEKSAGIFHIDNIAFDKRVRGMGLGKRLVLSLLQQCRKMGAEKVTVNAQAHAIGFYESCGFSLTGEKFPDENLIKAPMMYQF